MFSLVGWKRAGQEEEDLRVCWQELKNKDYSEITKNRRIAASSGTACGFKNLRTDGEILL